MTNFNLNDHFTRLCARLQAEKPPVIRLCGVRYENPRVQVVSGAVSLQGYTRDGRGVFFTIWGSRVDQIECLRVPPHGGSVEGTDFVPGSVAELNRWVKSQLVH